jgi:transcriptional regulator GlxA family with amidase domain
MILISYFILPAKSWWYEVEVPVRVSFLLVSGFMMTAYVLAVDALRLANWREGRRLFEWDVRTPDDKPAEASNGMMVAPDALLDAGPSPNAAFICAGFSPEQGCSKPVFKWLRALERRRSILGGWDTGPLILAEAGLMDGRRMALHWQAAPAVQERYPGVEIVTDNCQTEKYRFTGPGGLSTFDLIVSFIEQEVGTRVARMVEKSANWNVAMAGKERASFALPFKGAGSSQLARVISVMEKEIEKSPSIPVIAEQCGISERALYRMFREHLSVSPKSYFLNLRLQHARDLLRQSNIPIAEIAVATGFNSASRFSQAFFKFFRESPTAARRQPRWLQVGHASSKQGRLVRTDP